MTFTRRTYRVAIRRAIQRESDLRAQFYALTVPMEDRPAEDLLTQINHTRRLQQRKRRERK